MREQALFNMSSGPVEGTNRTLRALSRQIMYHHDPEFIEIWDDTEDKLKKFFKTKNDVVIMQGEALLGLEATPLFVRGWFKLQYARGAVIVGALALINLFTWSGYPWVLWPAGALLVIELLRRLSVRSR